MADHPEPAGGAATSAVAPKKSKLPLLLAVLVPAAVGAWLAVSQHSSISALAGNDAAAPAAATAAPEPDPPAPTSQELPADPEEFGVFSEIQGLIINPAGSNGTRYLMVNIGFESDSEKTLEALGEREVVVRDAILRILSERTVESLADIGTRDTLKMEIQSAVNGVLSEGQIQRLYFTQYVLQ